MNKFYGAYCRSYQAVFRVVSKALDWTGPQVIKGAGSVKKLPALLKASDIKNVMIVTDKVLHGLGLLDSLKNGLDEKNISYVVYDGTQPNPTIPNVEEARELYINHNCEAVIAFGGGSPMDCAKAAATRIAWPKKTLQQLSGLLRIHRKLPTIIAIPTTAGTGSETTPTAVITDAKTRHIHDQVCVWAYKKNEESGRVVITGSHPEIPAVGERLEMMSAMILYAMDGNGIEKVKGELIPGELREMKKSTADSDPLHTKIGDLQYHHFKVTVRPNTKKLVIYLDGYNKYDGFDLSLCAKAGEFAFHHNTDIKNVSLGCRKSLIIDTPQAGDWYISVRCENTVETLNGQYGTEYITGKEVLNGVPYKIKVECKK